MKKPIHCVYLFMAQSGVLMSNWGLLTLSNSNKPGAIWSVLLLITIFNLLVFWVMGWANAGHMNARSEYAAQEWVKLHGPEFQNDIRAKLRTVARRMREME